MRRLSRDVSMIINRRMVILGAPVMIIGATCTCAVHAQPTQSGCWTKPDEVEDVARTIEHVSLFSNGTESIEPKSGNNQLDRALARGIASLGRQFGVIPGFAYYRDGAQPNARATSQILLGNTDGTVLFGLTLLNNLVARTRPDAAIMAVCAHEFAHILSFKNGMIHDLVPNFNVPFRGEQFADYMAGYYAGAKRRTNPSFPAVVFATTQNSFGGGSHGTGAQRGEAVQQGYLLGFQGEVPVDVAAQSAFNYSMSQNF